MDEFKSFHTLILGNVIVQIVTKRYIGNFIDTDGRLRTFRVVFVKHPSDQFFSHLMDHVSLECIFTRLREEYADYCPECAEIHMRPLCTDYVQA